MTWRKTKIFYKTWIFLQKKKKPTRTKIYNLWVKNEIDSEKPTVFCDEKQTAEQKNNQKTNRNGKCVWERQAKILTKKALWRKSEKRKF